MTKVFQKKSTIRKTLLFLLVCSSFGAVQAQQDSTALLAPQSEGFMQEGKTLYEEVSRTKKTQEYFNLFLYMYGGFNSYFQDGFQNGRFYMRDLRFEVTGRLTDWLSYRYRQRLIRSMEGSHSYDNVPPAIDVAGLNLNLSKKMSIFIGKQPTAFGGIEYDMNAITIYEYSDIGYNLPGFLTGAGLSYALSPAHLLTFQVVNSLNESVESTYGPGVQAARMPLLYALYWAGNFGKTFETKWSVSMMNQTRNKYQYMVALGNRFNFGRFGGYLDLMYSNEAIDRTGIITSTIGTNNGHNALNTAYKTVTLQTNYRVAPKWNVVTKGTYDVASTTKNVDAWQKGKYRTAWSYQGGIEFYPMYENLRFFLMYVGRSYDYTDKAKSLGNTNYSTSRVELGFSYFLPAF